MKTVVLSCPGREATTIEMVTALERQNPGAAFFVYRTDVRPASLALYQILWDARGADLLFLEDDIITARNFLAYAARWSGPHVTSFFHVNRTPWALSSPVDFSFSQAVKFPAEIVARMLAAKRLRADHTDTEIGLALEALQEKVIYHPSLVQHVGARSVAWGPERTLDHRVAHDFPGEAFDCLSLL